jgi:hypothetical protein
MAHQRFAPGLQGRCGGPRGSAPPPVPASEFAKQVPFDERGEPIELPVMLHGMPTWYYYYGNSVYIYPPPLHTWRLILTYEPREETRTRNALGEFTGALTGPSDVPKSPLGSLPRSCSR